MLFILIKNLPVPLNWLKPYRYLKSVAKYDFYRKMHQKIGNKLSLMGM
jgi:hypothetical protein